MCCTLRFHEMYVISLPPGAVAPPGGAAPCSSACAVAAAASQGARAASAWCACMAVCARSCPGMRCGRAAAGCAHPRMAANSAAGAAAGAAACAVRCCLSCPLHLQRRVQGRRAGLGQVPDAQVAVCCASGQQVGAEAVELQALDLRGSSVHAGEGGEALVGASLQSLATASPRPTTHRARVLLHHGQQRQARVGQDGARVPQAHGAICQAPSNQAHLHRAWHQCVVCSAASRPCGRAGGAMRRRAWRARPCARAGAGAAALLPRIPGGPAASVLHAPTCGKLGSACSRGPHATLLKRSGAWTDASSVGASLVSEKSREKSCGSCAGRQ